MLDCLSENAMGISLDPDSAPRTIDGNPVGFAMGDGGESAFAGGHEEERETGENGREGDR